MTRQTMPSCLMAKMILAAALLLAGTVLHAQTIEVRGRVLDENGEPLAGAGVIEKGKAASGTITDTDGNYTIKADEDSFLEFSFIGYAARLEAIAGKTEINVRLMPKTTTLDDVIVIGYGTSRKGDLTGSVAVLEAEALQGSPASNVSSALQGKIAGAEFMSQSGAPGEAGTIRIRGTRSISAGNGPLIILDGMMDAVDDLSEINPADIVSISVLKDVSSTAIYGSRGANGVILVTTSASPDSKPSGTLTVKFNAKAGASAIAGGIDIMDASEIAQWRNMVYQARELWSDKATALPYPEPSAFGKGTDWVKALSRTAAYQDYYLSLKGSSGSTRWSASIGYNNEQGIIIGSGNQRISGVFSFSTRLKPWLDAGIRASITDTRTDQTNAAISGTSANAAINLSPMLKITDEWNIYGADEGSGGAIFDNPYLKATKMENWLRRNTITFAPYLKATLNRYLVLNVKFSYARNNTWTFRYSPSDLPVATYNLTGGTATRGAYLKQTILNENTLTYRRNIGKNTFEGIAGISYERRQIDSESLSGSGYLDDDVTYHNMAGIHDYGNLVPKSYQTINQKFSAFGRFNWSYGRRYYITATVRADGASNFAAGKKWGVFPAIAFRWSIVNEKWFKTAFWLNDLSLRLSAGQSGNDSISSYMSLATITPGKTHWTFGDSRETAYTPSKLANSNLTWETTDSYNIGLNFEAFRSRLKIEADAYLAYTHDLLLSMRTSQVTGYNTYFNNVGSTRNIGLEVTLTTRNVETKNFKWSTTITAAHNRQTTIDVGTDETVPTYMNPRSSSQYLYGYRNGYPVNSLWGFQYEGVWKSAEEIERNKSTHAYTSGHMSTSVSENLGRSKYVDVNHDGMLDESDIVYLGCADAIVYGGFQNDFRIGKRLSVGIYFTYSIGGQIYNLSELYLGTGSSSYNKYRYMLNAWTPSNPDSGIPAPYREDLYGCSRFIHDASYLRLKTVSIDYSVPVPRSMSKAIKKLTVGVSADNLYLLKRYNGFDPDVNTSSDVYRLDNESLPRPRTIIGKISLTF
ncbi:MAG: SusC/RagA family TonB-linked outer membrane protein [Clostridium sp.]|nr:SusC/RagA family TonB-linked outer membrane protein [Bacteroides sp.]MCM1198874.1 SusC/RagA family TonB-linked outer membrane protein [Clostridium sp.]